jgi:hypothetical protein
MTPQALELITADGPPDCAIIAFGLVLIMIKLPATRKYTLNYSDLELII